MVKVKTNFNKKVKKFEKCYTFIYLALVKTLSHIFQFNAMLWRYLALLTIQSFDCTKIFSKYLVDYTK